MRVSGSILLCMALASACTSEKSSDSKEFPSKGGTGNNQVSAVYANGKVTLSAPASLTYDDCEFTSEWAFRYKVKADDEWDYFFTWKDRGDWQSWYENGVIKSERESTCDTGPEEKPVNGLVLELPSKVLRKSGEKALEAQDVSKTDHLDDEGGYGTYKEGDMLPVFTDTDFVAAKVVLQIYSNGGRDSKTFEFEVPLAKK